MMKMTSMLVLAGVLAGFSTTAVLADRGDGPDRGAMLLERFDEIDADKSGTITEAEIEAHRLAQFALADANGDGGLDAAELAAFQARQAEARMAERAARMLEERDTDSDGKLTAAEMAVETRFARADTDGDGAISKAEATAAMQKMAERGKHRRGDKGDN